MPVPFENKTIYYKKLNEDGKTESTGQTTPETWQYMKERYVVLRDFIPKEILTMALDMWKVDERASKEKSYVHKEKKDITYKNPQSSIGKSDGGYCTPWAVAMHGYLTRKLENFFDMDLAETYSYTRKYERGAFLGTHLDRPSCEVSATLCLEYQTDDNTPWKIWVKPDNYVGRPAEQVKKESQDLSQRDRLKNNCRAVSLEPGDLLLYQGPNIPHWRDYLLGDYSYHMFVHWFNRQTKMDHLPDFCYQKSRKVQTAQYLQALELDGRPDRWHNDQPDTEEFRAFSKFSEIYYSQNELHPYVNNYDDLVLDEKRMKREATK